MTQPTTDTRAVVRAIDALTTQVGRVADALTTPVTVDALATDDAPTTGDDGPRCVCGDPIEWYTAPGDAAGWVHSSGSGTLCLTAHTVRPHPWCAQPSADLPTPEPIPAADEDALRTARRDSLLVLLSRAARGTLIPEEGDLLRKHVEDEIREGEQQRTRADQAEEDARRALEQRQEMAEERYALQEQRDAADRMRAEVQRDRDQHAAVLTDVLDRFTHDNLEPRATTGYQCLLTVPTTIFERWRSVIAPTVEQPWWQQVAEARGELTQAQTAIERVRTEVRAMAQELHAAEDDGMRAAVNRVLAALDGTEQRTTEA